MAVPDFQTMMLPFLQVAQDQQEHSLREITAAMAKYYNLTIDDVEERVPSGQQTKLNNRVSWISTYFKKAGIVENPKRGYFKITARGLSLLNQNLTRIDLKVLQQFPEFVEFRTSKSETTNNLAIETIVEESQTPEEALETAYKTIRIALATEILDKVKSCSPSFFERLVVELLVKMGYGGTLQDAVGEILGKSGDGGVDGVIKEDRLGLDVIYIQAKRWEGVVGSSAIRDFAGALLQKKARKGVFITTSNFTESAKTFVKDIESTGSKIILINGEELADLMIDYNVGVSVATTYEIKRIDSDYFSEE
jgi:restriction system protein